MSRLSIMLEPDALCSLFHEVLHKNLSHLESEYPFCIGLLSCYISYPKVQRILEQTEAKARKKLTEDPETALNMIKDRLALSDNRVKLTKSPRRVFLDLRYANPGHWVSMVLPLCLLEPILLLEHNADCFGAGVPEYIKNLPKSSDPKSSARTEARAKYKDLFAEAMPKHPGMVSRRVM